MLSPFLSARRLFHNLYNTIPCELSKTGSPCKAIFRYSPLILTGLSAIIRSTPQLVLYRVLYFASSRLSIMAKRKFWVRFSFICFLIQREQLSICGGL